MIHRPAIDYGNGGLEWRGSTRITMYDKVLKQTKRPGNVIRLEVELRGKKLAQLLNSGIPVTSLDFRVCYGAYRRIVQMFRPIASPQCRDTLDLIAFTAQRYSIDLWPHWKTVYKNRQSANRARRRLLGLKLSYYKIDWATLLPNSRPRVRIDVAKGKVTKTLLLTICPPTGNKRSGMM
ncbi:MAG: hypothetical protein H0W20_00815 [Chthoniobacterales bacterium]|nr:hypothetical protein [Chthoniobacterales bacterium]